MRRGLVFGKFMPLHRGHQLLIERALAAMDDVTVVVYDSLPAGDYASMPVDLRARWITDLYPEVAVVPLDDPLRDAMDSTDPAHAGTYASGVEFLGHFDCVFTSEPAYERFAKLLKAEHVVLDAARELVPISGTRIREDLYAHRAWLEPRVYASLVQKVALVGTESTGKTTLARALAERHDTLWAHEYGRELWIEQGGGAAFADYLKIARMQHRREEQMRLHSRRFLFCDTTPWTTLHWSLRGYGTADPRLRDLADRTMSEYTWFVCDDDFPWIQDGWREMGDGEAHRFQRQQVDDLDARGVPYLVLSGTIEQRLERVAGHLQRRSPDKVR